MSPRGQGPHQLDENAARAAASAGSHRVSNLLRGGRLVVGVFDELADVHAAIGEMQKLIGARVGGKPEFAVDLLAIGYKRGSKVRRVLAPGAGALSAAGFAAGLYNDEV